MIYWIRSYLLAICLLTVAVPSWSLSEGFYTGLELGYSVSAYTGNNVKVQIPQLNEVGVPLATAASELSPAYAAIPLSGILTVENDGVGGRLYLGYKFYKILAIEGGYTRYADAVISNTFQLSSANPIVWGNNSLIGANTRVEQQALDLSAKLFIPVLDLFSLYGLLGISYLDTFLPTKASLEATPQSNGGNLYEVKITRAHQNNYAMLYGFGGGYSFNDSFIVGLTYQQLQPSSTQIQRSSLLALDMIFSFG